MKTITIHNPQNVYFFSDPHFDHANIIRYCHRPFRSIPEMNEKIYDNFQHTVKQDSLVFFLGDMSFGRHCHNALWWLLKLNGKFVYIRGSHDLGANTLHPSHKIMAIEKYLLLETQEYKLLLIHHPNDATILPTTANWIIHGHTHRSYIVNERLKRINVCVEATGYVPIRLLDIIELANLADKNIQLQKGRTK